MFYEKLTLLHQTTLECLNETDENKIIKAFTDLGLNILEASFGFVWLNSYASNEFKLIYKSPGTPYSPRPPRRDGRNYRAIKNRTPHYISDVRKQPDMLRISGYLRSLAIIPISYCEETYGNIVLCFKKEESFPKEKRMLCAFIGNSAGQAITIRRLLTAEQERPKAEFIADATHELRTPLAIIRGNVDLALHAKAKMPRETSEAFQAIHDEVRHMSELVSDLALLVSSGGSARKKSASHAVRLDALISRVAKRCTALAHTKRISIRMAKMPPATISGDEQYLEKMFANLINNAIYYGKPKGSVKIALSEKKGMIHIDIRDDGIGISKKDLPRVFERFYRGAQARLENHEGTGLGLAIVKWITEAHGGTVSVKSRESEGTTFRISLPALA